VSIEMETRKEMSKSRHVLVLFTRDAEVVAVERRRAFNPVAPGEGVFAERDRMTSTSSCGAR
jgi:hypothetical protein